MKFCTKALVFVAALALPTTSSAFVYDREMFSVEVPPQWRVDTSASDYAPDSNFALISERGSIITFSIDQTPMTDEQLLGNALQALEGLGVTPVRSREIYSWGATPGLGKEMDGYILSIYPGRMTVFAARNGRVCLMVTETVFAEAAAADAEGVETVRQTFVFKSDAAEESTPPANQSRPLRVRYGGQR